MVVRSWPESRFAVEWGSAGRRGGGGALSCAPALPSPPLLPRTATASCVKRRGLWPWSQARRSSSTCVGAGRSVRRRARAREEVARMAFACSRSRSTPSPHLARVRGRVQQARHPQALQRQPPQAVPEDGRGRAARGGEGVLKRRGATKRARESVRVTSASVEGAPTRDPRPTPARPPNQERCQGGRARQLRRAEGLPGAGPAASGTEQRRASRKSSAASLLLRKGERRVSLSTPVPARSGRARRLLQPPPPSPMGSSPQPHTPAG